MEEIVGTHPSKTLPKMMAVQAEGSAPIARAFKAGKKDSIEPVLDPHTEASAINIGSPVSWTKSLAAIYDSGGSADYVSDEEIFVAQKLLASKEGLFVEPASAAPIAYLTKLARAGKSDEYEGMKNSYRCLDMHRKRAKGSECLDERNNSKSVEDDFSRCKIATRDSCIE